MTVVVVVVVVVVVRTVSGGEPMYVHSMDQILESNSFGKKMVDALKSHWCCTYYIYSLAKRPRFRDPKGFMKGV